MIKLTDVHLRYPVMGHVSHSFQRAFLNKVGGFFRPASRTSFVSYVDALRGVNLSLADGDRLGIVGHNGAGKSTLLRVLTGVYPPTLGTVSVNGKINALTDISLGMDMNATGLKNIVFRLVFMGRSFREAREAVDEIVEYSELGEFIHLPVRTYSTGMFLRLAFAISTHFVPDILVMDELLSAGDMAFQEKAQERLRTLFDKSRIIVLAAHSLDAIQANCNRAVILSRGEIIHDGTPEETLAAYKAGER